jgi:hypothetical protein
MPDEPDVTQGFHALKDILRRCREAVRRTNASGREEPINARSDPLPLWGTCGHPARTVASLPATRRNFLTEARGAYTAQPRHPLTLRCVSRRVRFIYLIYRAGRKPTGPDRDLVTNALFQAYADPVVELKNRGGIGEALRQRLGSAAFGGSAGRRLALGLLRLFGPPSGGLVLARFRAGGARLPRPGRGGGLAYSALLRGMRFGAGGRAPRGRGGTGGPTARVIEEGWIEPWGRARGNWMDINPPPQLNAGRGPPRRCADNLRKHY